MTKDYEAREGAGGANKPQQHHWQSCIDSKI